MVLRDIPKLIDESTSGLDPVVRDNVLEILGEFTRDESHSILISSHITSDLEKICDYVAFLHKGSLLLCDEKDVLLEKYCMIRCPKERLAQLPENAVKGMRVSPYGVQALVLREAVPAGMETGQISLEDLFIYMVKEMV